MKKYRLNKKKFSDFCWNLGLAIGWGTFTIWFMVQVFNSIIG